MFPPRRPETYLILGALLAVVLVLAVLGILLAADSPVAPVSNPGAGREAPAIAPPPRFDWTDQ